MPVLFYRVKGEKYGAFSNFSNHPITSPQTLFPTVWKTSEHLFQALKFFGVSATRFAYVAEAPGPKMAAAIGRSRELPIRPNWDSVKVDAMRFAVGLKVQQHKDVQELLLSTGDEQIVEDSPTDSFWGWGADHQGQNWLGRILMEVRTALRGGTLDAFVHQAWDRFVRLP